MKAEVEGAKNQKPNGWEVAYETFTINGRCLGYGDPIRVREGQRVMFRILNASATETIELALPGHDFYVVGLDGNPVPSPIRSKRCNWELQSELTRSWRWEIQAFGSLVLQRMKTAIAVWE